LAANRPRRPRDFPVKKIKRDLPPGRWAHSLSVARLAESLGRRWGVNPERAFIAGVLHDCARGLAREQQRALLHGYRGRTWDKVTRSLPPLWHAAAAAVLARRRYGVRDPGVLRALALHSTGAPGMRTLDKILFVADYAEPRRRFAAAALRRLAVENLDAAVAAAVRAKNDFLRSRGAVVHPRSQALLASLAKKRR
jgi:predicted HD superfamily hydrolase involved in NAD metabolism